MSSSNEKSSKALGTLASKVLKTGNATPAQAKKLAGSVLTQRPNKK